MSKHLIKIDNPQHVAISVAHAGLDNQYCEAGEVVAIDWQPSSGWGLQEAHYTDEDGNVVSIDLSVREFTMPAKAVTVSGTAKRFVVEDWDGYEPNPTYEGVEGDVMQSDGHGGITANPKVNVSAKGNVSAAGDVSAKGNVSAKGGKIKVGSVNIGGTIEIYDVAGNMWSITVDSNGHIQVTAG